MSDDAFESVGTGPIEDADDLNSTPFLTEPGFYHVEITAVEKVQPVSGAPYVEVGLTVLAGKYQGKTNKQRIFVRGKDGGDLGDGQRYLLRALVGLGLTTSQAIDAAIEEGVSLPVDWDSLVATQHVVELQNNKMRDSDKVFLQVAFGRWFPVNSLDLDPKKVEINQAAFEKYQKIQEQFASVV